MVIAFDKERVHSAVEIEIFGLCIHRHRSDPPPPPPRKQGRMTSLRSTMCIVSSGILRFVISFSQMVERIIFDYY